MMTIKGLLARTLVAGVAIAVAVGTTSTATQAARNDRALRTNSAEKTQPPRAWMQPGFGSEYLVPDASVEQVGNRFRLRIHNRLALGGSSPRMMWFIDTRDQSYQIFLLGDPEVDAGYIYAYLRTKGVETSLDRVKANLIAKRERSEAARLESRRWRQAVGIRQRPVSQSTISTAERPDGSELSSENIESGSDISCDGDIYSEVVVEDPIGIDVALTRIRVTVEGNEYAVMGTIQSDSAPCWSATATILLTTWSTLFCDHDDSTFEPYYEAYRTGIYYNDDFPPGFPELQYTTTVLAEAWAGWDPFGGVWTDFVYDTAGAWGQLLSGTPDSWNTVLCW